MRSRRIAITTALMLACAVLLATVGSNAAVAAVLPTTTITADPSLPNGVPPWYLATPEVFVAADQSATVYYWWSSGPVKQKSVSTDTPVSIGLAPEGADVLSAYAVSAAGTETALASRVFYVDTLVPGRPAAVAGDVVDGDVELTWEGATDVGASGISGYWVYRSDESALFDVGDRIGFTTATEFTDSSAPTADLMWYAVTSRDVAGNESLLSESVRPARPARVAGSDRFATALRASQAAFGDGSASTVVFASGLDYPDALCAAGLAGAVDGPILLLRDDYVGSDVRTELTRLGAVDAYVVGGTGVVSRDVVDRLEAILPGSVTRLAGSDRYATAVAVADEIAAVRGPVGRAYLASGLAFPDALSAAPAAFSAAEPILFARPDSVPGKTLAALADHGITTTVIVGGPGAVTPQAESATPGAVRVAGSNRYATSRAFADWAASDGVLAGERLVLATGMNFPDGLVAGPLAGRDAGPVVLTNTSDVSALTSWLAADPYRFDSVYIMGGPGALGTETEVAVSAALSID